MTLAIPSLSSAFSALSSSMPTLSPTAYGGVFAPPKNAANPFSLGGASSPATPNMSSLFGGGSSSSPAPNMSTPSGPAYGGSPAVPKISPTPSTPTATGSAGASVSPAAPAIPQLPASMGGYKPSPYVTTPSGATVDPNTGKLISGPTSQPYASASTGGVGTYGGDQGTGSAPSGPAVPTFNNNPLITNPDYEAAWKAYSAASTPSQNELDSMARLNALNSSLTEAYANTDNQPIALEFQTGQKAALQRSASALASPLEAELATAQAGRQLAMTAADVNLQKEQAKLSAAQELAKPVATSYGGTLSRYNPATGTYDTVVNPFGSAASTAAGAPSTTDVIGQAIASGQLTSDQVTRYGIPFIAATLAADPGYNFITQKASTTANTQSLAEQQKYVDTVTRAFNTANDNLSQLITFMTGAGINSGSNVPLVNSLQNAVKGGLTDAGTIAGFNSALQGLRSEYAQVLARGGEVTDSTRNTALQLIPDNITPAQLQQVADRLNVEGKNAIGAATQQVQTIQSRLGSNAGGSSGSSSGSSGSGSSSSSSVGWY